MLKNRLFSKKISKKLSIILLAGSISIGQSFNINATLDFSFFGNLINNAKENLYEALGYNKIKKCATIAAYGLAGFAGYKLIAKPLACNLFGKPAKFTTKILDKGIKLSIFGAFVGAAIYLYHLYNKKELLNAINKVDKNVTKTREDLTDQIIKTETKLESTINTRSDAIDAQISNVKNDTKTIKNDTKKILDKVDQTVKITNKN